MDIITDNTLLAHVQKADKDKPIEDRGQLHGFGIDAALNWTRSAESIHLSRVHAVEAGLDDYRQRGFTDNEAREMLVAAGHSDEDILRVLDGNGSDADAIAPQVASKYEHVAARIERLAETTKPSEFLSVVTADSDPNVGVVRLREPKVADLEALLRHIAVRKTAGPKMTQPLHQALHGIMKPFVEEEILRSGLEAQVKSDDTVVAATSRNGIVSVAINKKEHFVNMDALTCNCDRFSDGHFADMGIPCEHVLLATKELA